MSERNATIGVSRFCQRQSARIKYSRIKRTTLVTSTVLIASLSMSSCGFIERTQVSAPDAIAEMDLNGEKLDGLSGSQYLSLVSVFIRSARIAKSKAGFDPFNFSARDVRELELEGDEKKELENAMQKLAPHTNAPEAFRQFFIDGANLQRVRCTSYFSQLGRIQQPLKFGTQQLALLGGSTAALLALLDAGATAVAITAAAFAFTTASLQNFENEFLYGPDVDAVANLIARAQQSYLSAVENVASYSDAVRLLRDFESLCEPSGIRALVNASLETANVSAETLAGGLTQAKYARLFNFLNVNALSYREVRDLYWVLFELRNDDKEKLKERLQRFRVLFADDGNFDDRQLERARDAFPPDQKLRDDLTEEIEETRAKRVEPSATRTAEPAASRRFEPSYGIRVRVN